MCHAWGNVGQSTSVMEYTWNPWSFNVERWYLKPTSKPTSKNLTTSPPCPHCFTKYMDFECLKKHSWEETHCMKPAPNTCRNWNWNGAIESNRPSPRISCVFPIGSRRIELCHLISLTYLEKFMAIRLLGKLGVLMTHKIQHLVPLSCIFESRDTCT